MPLSVVIKLPEKTKVKTLLQTTTIPPWMTHSKFSVFHVWNKKQATTIF